MKMLDSARPAVVLLLLSGRIAFALPDPPHQAASTPNVRPELNLKALAEPLQDLTPADRRVVDESIRLIREMSNVEALADLTNLTRTNSKNSTLRVLRAYALLELGNLTGALDDATVAEASGTHTPYKCWFLAQVAYLAGNKPLCRREIKHVSRDATYRPQAERLHRSLDAETGSK